MIWCPSLVQAVLVWLTHDMVTITGKDFVSVAHTWCGEMTFTGKGYVSVAHMMC